MKIDEIMLKQKPQFAGWRDTYHYKAKAHDIWIDKGLVHIVRKDDSRAGPPWISLPVTEVRGVVFARRPSPPKVVPRRKSA